VKCPVCVETVLQITERQSIEIDYCPNCRGVWLDRGELDKIVERAAQSDLKMANAIQPGAAEIYSQHHKHRDQFGRENRKRQRKGGLLAELFDFD